MMQMRDWISGLIGLVIFLLGLFPILRGMGYGSDWWALEFLPVEIFTYIVAIAGFYLMVNSIIEITNSNIVGWVSFSVAVLVIILGLFPLLHGFGRGPDWFAFTWISRTIYNIIFIIEGLFLMIATFAMEL